MPVASPPRIYLAGPDVFRPDSAAVFARLKACCARLGLAGLEPADDGPAEDAPQDGDALAQRIYEGNIARIRAADGVLANLADFRGLEPDPGTVFEVGYAVALGKPVVAYGVPPGSYAERVGAVRACAPDARGVLREIGSGAMVEGLGQRLNLMLTRSAEIAETPEAALQRLAQRLGVQPALQIRAFAPDDARALHGVFHSAVHQTAARDYDAAQRAAWAPADPDHAAWAARLQRNRPSVALWHGQIAGFADLQPDGLIDQFFVAGTHGGLGIGQALMDHLLAQARARGLDELHADVSLTAEGFFARNGFVVLERRQPVRHGVALRNAAMRRTQAAAAYNPAA
ncbi:GNAT family N-acetyltransferase [Pseudorhodoferax sp.]|uniref:GNAT family N-acetyltransferase n=1 Tax=Pseudorhodoferax sp. TaxID=1993553 RepID=UPI002DD6A305|nr:GNAT family N-acetyltransferase [Pseudorhodoferax sp.]